MAFTRVTVNHTFLNADNTPASGQVTFTLSRRITNGTQTVVPAKITESLDPTGALSVQLFANTDAGTIPQDSRWRVDFDIQGADAEELWIVVAPSGTAVDLGSLIDDTLQPG